MESYDDGVLCGSVRTICKMIVVDICEEIVFDVLKNQSLEALHNYRDDCLSQGAVEDSGEDEGELVGTRSEHLARHSVRAGSLPGVHCQEHLSDIVLPHSE